MKRFLRKMEEALADAALLEMGVEGVSIARCHRIEDESLEENLIEVAFAEAADFEDIHKAIIREHRDAWKLAHPNDEDNSLCFV
jgi:hypothetical protein